MTKENGNNNYLEDNSELISFSSFNYLREVSPELEVPRIYAIFCPITKNTAFYPANDLLFWMNRDFEELFFDRFQGPDEIDKDFKKYGPDNMYFILFEVGREWVGTPKRIKQIKKIIKERWPPNYKICNLNMYSE